MRIIQLGLVPAVVALEDAIRFHNSLGQQRKDDHYNYLWSETKIIDKESRLDWLSFKL